jgi:transcriptional regulator with XRE-family HTH domain
MQYIANSLSSGNMDGSPLVREARRRAGLSQAELAARAGTTQSAIARLERGRASASFRRVSELVEACGLELRVHLAPLPPLPASSPVLPEDLRALLREVAGRELPALVAGDAAAVLHGVAVEAATLTLVPADGRRELEAIAAMLDAVHARLRVDGGSLPFERDPASLASTGRLELVTSLGPLELDPRPPGTGGYRDLARDASFLTVDGRAVRVASLGDVVRIAAATEPLDDERLALLRRALAGTLPG